MAPMPRAGFGSPMMGGMAFPVMGGMAAPMMGGVMGISTGPEAMNMMRNNPFLQALMMNAMNMQNSQANPNLVGMDAKNMMQTNPLLQALAGMGTMGPMSMFQTGQMSPMKQPSPSEPAAAAEAPEPSAGECKSDDECDINQQCYDTTGRGTKPKTCVDPCKYTRCPWCHVEDHEAVCDPYTPSKPATAALPALPAPPAAEPAVAKCTSDDQCGDNLKCYDANGQDQPKICVNPCQYTRCPKCHVEGREAVCDSL